MFCLINSAGGYVLSFGTSCPADTEAGYGAGVMFLVLGIPLIAAMSAVGTAVFHVVTRGPRRKPGHCPCGYDLTGNVTGRCPECGQAFEAMGDGP